MATTAATLDEVGEHRMIIGETHEDMLVLTLESQEKDIFVIPKKIALQSILIQTMVKSDPQETRIVLPNIKSSLLRKVIEYITYHDKLIPKMIEAPMTSTDMKTVNFFFSFFLLFLFFMPSFLFLFLFLSCSWLVNGMPILLMWIYSPYLKSLMLQTIWMLPPS
jgi:hypothetical protein